MLARRLLAARATGARLLPSSFRPHFVGFGRPSSLALVSGRGIFSESYFIDLAKARHNPLSIVSSALSTAATTTTTTFSQAAVSSIEEDLVNSSIEHVRQLSRTRQHARLLRAVDDLLSSNAAEQLSARHFVVLISELGRCGLWQRAVMLHDQLISFGIEPNLQTFTAAMQACSIPARTMTGRSARSNLESTQEMNAEGTQAVKAADILYEEMKSYGIVPDVACHNVRLRLCARYTDAWAIVQNDIVAAGLVPEQASLATLAQRAVVDRQCEAMVRHYDELVEKFRLKPDWQLQAQMLSVFAGLHGFRSSASGKSSIADQRFDRALEELLGGIVIEHVTNASAGSASQSLPFTTSSSSRFFVPLTTVLSVCAKHGLWKEALRVMEVARGGQSLESTARSAARGSAIEATVSVTNLPFAVNGADVQKFFQRFGPVAQVHMPRNPRTGRSRGFAYVEFADAGAASKALRSALSLGGRKLRVAQANDAINASHVRGGDDGDWNGEDNSDDNMFDQSERDFAQECPVGCKTLHVSNLPFTATDEEVAAVFGCETKHAVRAVRLPRHRDSGRPRGFGFVEFTSHEAAAAALKAAYAASKTPEGLHLGGRQLLVSPQPSPNSKSRRQQPQARPARNGLGADVDAVTENAMQKREEIMPLKLRHYRFALDACAKAGAGRAARRLFNEDVPKSMQPSLIGLAMHACNMGRNYKATLTMYHRFWEGEGYATDSDARMQAALPGGVLDHSFFHPALEAAVQLKQLNVVFLLLSDMHSCNLPLTSRALTMSLSATVGDPQYFPFALSLYESRLDSGAVQPNSFAMNEIIRGHRALRAWDAVEATYRGLGSYGVEPTAPMQRAYLQALLAQGKFDLADTFSKTLTSSEQNEIVSVWSPQLQQEWTRAVLQLCDQGEGRAEDGLRDAMQLWRSLRFLRGRADTVDGKLLHTDRRDGDDHTSMARMFDNYDRFCDQLSRRVAASQSSDSAIQDWLTELSDEREWAAKQLDLFIA